MGKAKYLWLDLETTGLDPHKSWILECAAIVTDANLIERGSCERVLRFVRGPDDVLDPYVVDMHTRNGLWEACARSLDNPVDLRDDLQRMIASEVWDEGRPILAGATVHFDRSFLRQHVGRIESQLHHRHLDVSSLKLMRCDVDGVPWPKSEGVAHRAMADVRGSLEQAREIYHMFAHEDR